jgi:hypothetical protein
VLLLQVLLMCSLQLALVPLVCGQQLASESVCCALCILLRCLQHLDVAFGGF